MPKQVDHHARRTLIADALMRVAAERGLEAVSLRHVAAEAGVSSGMVQHYFRTKDEMMTFAMAVVSENVQARLAAEDLDSAPLADQVRALLVQLLPVDEQRRVEGQVALAFFAYAAGRPGVAEALRAETEPQRAMLADQIRAAQDAGEARTDVDPTQAAITLLALVDGLGMHVLGEYYSRATALATFDAYLADLFRPGQQSQS